ncbi:MAG: acyltransferase family protein [Clostridia bacterium]|nr:acyltransferase family protein [Clostridia bacterium]
MTKKALPKRNGEIDFWKFVASIYIVLFHSRAFYNPDLFRGAMALPVEFFFVVSGFFFASSVYRDQREFNSRTIGQETVGFIWHKIKGFLYYFLFGFGFSLIAVVYRYGPAYLFTLERIKNIVFEFFLINTLTSTSSSIIPADWYLSTMLTAMFFLYPLFRCKKDIFSAYIAPLVGIGGLGYLMFKYGVIAAGADGVFPSKGLIRAIVSICLGVAAYRVSEELKKKEFGRFGIAVCSGIGAVSVLGAFILFIKMPKEIQAFAVMLCAVFVAVSASGKSVFSKMFPAALCQKLGEFSLSLYLGHSAVRTAIQGFNKHHTILKPYFKNGDKQWIGVLIYLAGSCILAVVMIYMNKLLKKILDARKEAKTPHSVTVE